jgi:regulatory protein
LPPKTRRSSSCPPASAAELKARALRLLARREHSRAELERKLAARAESPEALETLLDALAAARRQSDERYAEERARSLARKYGAGRIRRDLAAKGIHDEAVDAVVRSSAAEELARARAILSRRFRAPPATLAERARRARFLQGRGFSFEVIRLAIGSHGDAGD